MAGKPQKTRAYKAFEKNLDRAGVFVGIFERDRGVGKPSAEDVQLLRGAVVFAIGALDAYLHDLVLEVVPEFVPHSDDLDKTLKGVDTQALVRAMASASDVDQARGELRRALDTQLDDKSFMGPSGLERAMRLVGCASSVEHVETQIGRENAAADLGRYTDIRHKIVHRGQNPSLTRDNARGCVSLVEVIAEFVDDRVIREHFRSK